MSRRLKLLGSLMAVIIIAALLFAFSGPANPMIQGRRLDAWIWAFNIRAPQPSPAADVLNANAPETDKLLRAMLCLRDTSWKLNLKRWLIKRKLLKIQFHTATECQMAALGACNWLGQDVRGTVPALASIVADYPTRVKDRAVMDYALHTLAIMGTNGITALSGLLTHPDPYIRGKAAWLLGTASLDGTTGMVEALKKSLQDPNAEVKSTATQALEFIEQRRKQRLIVSSDSPAAGADVPEPPSLWSVKQGAKITGNSGLAPGFTGAEALEATTHAPEPTALIFRDGRPDGFTHFIEWQTPEPVTIQSFGFIASHEGGNVQFQRAFRELRLCAWDEAKKEFIPFHHEYLRHPNGTSYYSAAISAFRNLDAPVTAQRFRLEVVQHGAPMFPGSKLIEIFGFVAPITEAQAVKVVSHQIEHYRSLKPTVGRLVTN